MESPRIMNHKRALSQLTPQPFDVIGTGLASVKKLTRIDHPNKFSLKIKMPIVKLDKKPPVKINLAPISPLKSTAKLIQLKLLDKTMSLEHQKKKYTIKNFTPFNDRNKYSVEIPNNHQPYRQNTYRLLPALNKVQNTPKIPNKSNIYFELLVFFIKKHVDYSHIYNSIDCNHKGWIEKPDLYKYLYINNINCNIEETVNEIYDISNLINPFHSKIYKKTFFAMCSAIKHDKPEDPKLFSTKSLKKLKKRIISIHKIFKTFTDSDTIQSQLIIQTFSEFTDDATTKSLQLIISEPVDFNRFLICLPFFMWMKSVAGLCGN